MGIPNSGKPEPNQLNRKGRKGLEFFFLRVLRVLCGSISSLFTQRFSWVGTVRFNHVLGVILLLGLVHGLLHVFLVPPWQHYDEPTHFEYAWLIANRLHLPQPDEYDQAMRRQVAASMLEYGFFNGLDFRPNLLAENEPVWIGISELRHPPAYYLLAALPLIPLRFSDITFQLYVARWVSLCLYLLSILIAWGAMKELVAPTHPLRWMVPATMVWLPSYTDLMTSVNNDVGAVVVFSLFLWGGLRLVRREFSVYNLLWAAGAAALCDWTKDTAFVALPLLFFFLLFSLLRGSRRWIAWALVFAGTLAGLLAVFSWGDAALWFRSTLQATPTRATTVNVPLGTHSFQLETLPGSPLVPSIYQLLPLDQVQTLRGKQVTVGAWMWATRSITSPTPVLYIDGSSQAFFRNIELGKQPGFYAVSATIPDNATRVRVSLEQPGEGAGGDTTVFYNGVVLAEGKRPIDESPRFDDADGTRGVWGGQPFRNVLRNASAASSWLSVRPWVDAIGARTLLGRPSTILDSLLDWQGAGWYYWATSQRMFSSFWATFGWGGVFLKGSQSYFILGLFTWAAGIGAVMALGRKRNALAWDVFLLLGLAVLAIWVPAMVRGVDQSLRDSVYIPVARYAYPAIIPTALILNLGWSEILRYMERWLHVSRKAQIALYWILFLALDSWALFSLVSFFSER